MSTLQVANKAGAVSHQIAHKTASNRPLERRSVSNRHPIQFQAPWSKASPVHWRRGYENVDAPSANPSPQTESTSLWRIDDISKIGCWCREDA